jgi:hypothetical protein
VPCSQAKGRLNLLLTKAVAKLTFYEKVISKKYFLEKSNIKKILFRKK